ncbi:MAG: hypothetical protein O2945_22510 [Planctomycetota bacterium]|nr:hypothetical protein [Planctomycetota bacterium]MDA0921848.1 hypothetical protein [Planctomycetota bacterium]
MAGSLQIGATVRQSWEVVRDPEDENRRLFLPGKNSNAKDRGGLAFLIVDSHIPLSDDGDFVGKVDWQPGTVDLSADQAARFSTDEESCAPWPVEWLRDFLANGAKPANEVQVAARSMSFSEKQLRTARIRLKVMTRKSDFKGGWIWELSVSNSPASSDSDTPPEAA